MNSDDRMDKYVDSARARMVPAGFADRLPLSPQSAPSPWARLWSKPWARTAIWVVGASIFVFRFLALVAFFVAG